MKMLKKATSLLLTLLLVMSVFTVIPFTASAEATNIAFGKTVTASSTSSEDQCNSLEAVVDGVTGSNPRWDSGDTDQTELKDTSGNDTNQTAWLQIDLGEGCTAEDVESIKIYFFNLKWPTSYSIKTCATASENEEDWTTIYSLTRETASAGQVDTISYVENNTDATAGLTQNTLERYVRFYFYTMNHSAQANNVGVYEVEIYGTLVEPSGGAITQTVETAIDSSTLQDNARSNSYSYAWSDGPACYAFTDGTSRQWNTAYIDKKTYSNNISEYSNTPASEGYYGVITFVDSSYSTYGEVNFSADNPVWLQTGWGGDAKTVSKITLSSKGLNTENLKIYAYNGESAPDESNTDYTTDTDWSEISFTSDTASNSSSDNYADFTLTLTPTEAKYIRLVMTATARSDGQISVKNMAVYEQCEEVIENITCENVTAVPLYKSHKIEWQSNANSAGNFTIFSGEDDVTETASITSVTVDNITYYTALVPVETGTGSGTAYTVKVGDITHTVTVSGNTGLDALLANGLYVYNTKTTLAAGETQQLYTSTTDAVKTAKLQNLATGTVVLTFSNSAFTEDTTVPVVNFANDIYIGLGYEANYSGHECRTHLENGSNFNDRDSSLEVDAVYSYATTVYPGSSNNILTAALNSDLMSQSFSGTYKIFDSSTFSYITLGSSSFAGSVYNLLIWEESFDYSTEGTALAAITAALKEKAERQELADLITEAQAVNEDEVTADSYSALQTALTTAQAVTDESSASEVTSALTALRTAVKSLVYRISAIDSTTLAAYASANSWSNTGNDGPASYAFNGNSSNWWHSNYDTASDTNINGSASADNPIWIQTGWGELKTITKLEYTARTGNQYNENGIKDVSVYYTTEWLNPEDSSASHLPDVINTTALEDSSSDVHWTLAQSFVVDATTYEGQVHTLTFDEPFDATGIRLVITSTNTVGGNSYVTASYIGVFEDTAATQTLTAIPTAASASADENSGITATYTNDNIVVTQDETDCTSANAKVAYNAEVSEGTTFAGWYDEDDTLVSTDEYYVCNIANAKALTAKAAQTDNTVQIAVGSNTVEVTDFTHAFEDKITKEEVEANLSALTDALSSYNNIAYNYTITAAEVLAENGTFTINATQTDAEYTVTASVNGEAKTDTEKYNNNFKNITADDTDSSNNAFSHWELTDDSTKIADSKAFNYVATSNMSITAVYSGTASTEVGAYIPAPVCSVSGTYNVVEVPVSFFNVVDENGTKLSTVSDFGIVLAKPGTTTDAIKSEITADTSTSVKKFSASAKTLTNKGRYLHRLQFTSSVPASDLYAYVVVDGTVYLSNVQSLSAAAAVATTPAE